MLKTRYLLILSLIISAIAFGSILYTVALGKVNPPEESSTHKLVLVMDYQYFDVASSVNQYHELASFDTEGYKYAYVMVKAEGSWQLNSNIQIWVFNNAFGIQTLGGQFGLNTNDPNRSDYGSNEQRFEINAPLMDLELQVYNSNVGFDGYLTIAVYLSN